MARDNFEMPSAYEKPRGPTFTTGGTANPAVASTMIGCGRCTAPSLLCPCMSGSPNWMHPPRYTIGPIAPTGWVCPVCNRGVAPGERMCDHGGQADPVRQMKPPFTVGAVSGTTFELEGARVLYHPPGN